jgi:hypothetical protein
MARMRGNGKEADLETGRQFNFLKASANLITVCAGLFDRWPVRALRSLFHLTYYIVLGSDRCWQ